MHSSFSQPVDVLIRFRGLVTPPLWAQATYSPMINQLTPKRLLYIHSGPSLFLLSTALILSEWL